jgi:nucleotide-binding universal stress UspA family protein
MLAVFHPTDLSPESENAFCHALKLALAGESRLTILHTDAPDERYTSWHEYPSVRGILERWDLIDAGALRADVKGELGIDVQKVELLGSDPVETMLRYLQRNPADLIVLSTHGRDGLPRFLRGSVAEPLARRAGTMALFVPHGVPGFVDDKTGQVQLERVLVPIDHGPDPANALRAAKAVAVALGCDRPLDLVHVGDEPPAVEGVRLVSGEGVVDTILAEATEHRVGLIVMATEGHDGILDALRGSTTEQVLRRAPCPVLAVPT